MSIQAVQQWSHALYQLKLVLSTYTEHVQHVLLRKAAVQFCTAGTAYRLPGADLVSSCKRELA